MKTCTNCGRQSYRIESKFCLGCGDNIANVAVDAPNINICTNLDCEYHKSQFIYPDDARFCDICGTSTAFAK
ncbi:MAG: hypothetical protein FWF76_02325 [Oscillospiraceae bacterium]|nr:hypothetical protein [Oscillospiraceae bacterium]